MSIWVIEWRDAGDCWTIRSMHKTFDEAVQIYCELPSGLEFRVVEYLRKEAIENKAL